MTHIACFDLFSTLETIHKEYVSSVRSVLHNLSTGDLSSFYSYCSKQLNLSPDEFLAELTDRVEQELTYR